MYRADKSLSMYRPLEHLAHMVAVVAEVVEAVAREGAVEEVKEH